jgi:hypothetical protein
MNVVFAVVIFSHLSGQPEDFTILLYDRSLACQDANDDFLQTTRNERLKEEAWGVYEPNRHERLICVPLPKTSPCVTVATASGRDARETTAYKEAYQVCRRLLGVE